MTSKLSKIKILVKKEGFLGPIKEAIAQINPEKIENFEFYKTQFKNKSGIEIGGPSSVFKKKGLVPIYKYVKNLDGCNYSNQTMWEGNIASGRTYNYYERKQGQQYILEATDLKDIPNDKYDFLISSNCLEHVANPLKAITEWKRIIKSGALFLLVLPNKEFSFDHNRPNTTFEHLFNDFQNSVEENDLTHLDEVLGLHDLSLNPESETFEQFKKMMLNNKEIRGIHHHVFDIPLISQMMDFINFEILMTASNRNHFVLAKKK